MPKEEGEKLHETEDEEELDEKMNLKHKMMNLQPQVSK
jgi:hypothetical protein